MRTLLGRSRLNLTLANAKEALRLAVINHDGLIPSLQARNVENILTLRAFIHEAEARDKAGRADTPTDPAELMMNFGWVPNYAGGGGWRNPRLIGIMRTSSDGAWQYQRDGRMEAYGFTASDLEGFLGKLEAEGGLYR